MIFPAFNEDEKTGSVGSVGSTKNRCIRIRFSQFPIIEVGIALDSLSSTHGMVTSHNVAVFRGEDFHSLTLFLKCCLCLYEMKFYFNIKYYTTARYANFKHVKFYETKWVMNEHAIAV